MLFELRALTLGTLLVSFAAAASTAPFQCASEVDPNKRREDEPGEALYNLAEQFRAKGDPKARVETLQFILKKYPSSRFAESAREDLKAMNEPEQSAKDPPVTVKRDETK